MSTVRAEQRRGGGRAESTTGRDSSHEGVIQSNVSTRHGTTHHDHEALSSLITPPRFQSNTPSNILRSPLSHPQSHPANTPKPPYSPTLLTQAIAASLIVGEADPTITNAKLEKGQSEAKLRQLTNKLEFLKAQLASEQSTINELKQVTNMTIGRGCYSSPTLDIPINQPCDDRTFKTHVPSRIPCNTPSHPPTHNPLFFFCQANERDVQKIEDLRMEFRLKMQEYDKRKEEAVAEAERRVTAVYEDRMVELTTLQAKMASVRGEPTDSLPEYLTRSPTYYLPLVSCYLLFDCVLSLF